MTSVKNIVYLLVFCLLSFHVLAQGRSWDTEDSLMVRSIFDEALDNGQSYKNLRSLCIDIGHRLTGSDNAAKAVIWGKEVLEKLPFDTVYLQEITAPFWERGDKEEAWINTAMGWQAMEISTLGGSVATDGTLQAEVIEVQGINELDSLKDQIKGKIVFYNRPMDKKLINTFESYGGCVDQRYWGASKAAQYGAVAVVVRSMTTQTDHHPHTGSMGYEDGVKKIPAVALSTASADLLRSIIREDPNVLFNLRLNCRLNPNIKSYNVIGEIRGKRRDEFMVVGGHLDSWDLGEGAHDDGAGIVHSIEALRLLMANGYRPEHSMRVVLYMNEENGNMGGKTYAEQAKRNKEVHIVALESDRGGFSPRGFSLDGNDAQVNRLNGFRDLLEPYGLHMFFRGFTGVDIYPLKEAKDSLHKDLLLMGLNPDPQRYFDYHHTEIDVFENVNQRELELGCASMAAILYLTDRYWESLIQ